MGHFSSFTLPLDFKPFFEKAGLEWDLGSYYHTEVALNKDSIVAKTLPSTLTARYHAKGVFLKNVSEDDSWYRTDERSSIHSKLFPQGRSKSACKVGESSVAFTRVGQGRLGYVGDVNTGKVPHTIVVVMCFLTLRELGYG